jgi:hypothetical protein
MMPGIDKRTCGVYTAVDEQIGSIPDKPLPDRGFIRERKAVPHGKPEFTRQ